MATGDTELEGVPVDAAEPVKSEEGDTELLAQRVEVTEEVKVADCVAQAVPDADAEGDRDGLRVKDSDAVPLNAVEGDAPGVTVAPIEALTETDADGHTVAVEPAEAEDPDEDVGGTVGVTTAERDARVVPEIVPHALGEPECEEESVNELEGEGVMVAESVATAVPVGVPVSLTVPEVEPTALRVDRVEAEEEMVGDTEFPAVTLADSEELPVADTRMEGVTVMVDTGLRVGVAVMQPVEVTLGLDESEDCAEALAAAEAEVAAVEVTAPVRLSDGLGVSVREADAEEEALAVEEAVPQEEPVNGAVAEEEAERDLGPLPVADAEVVPEGTQDGVTSAVRVSISAMEADAEAEAVADAAAESVCDTVLLTLKEGDTDTEADAEGELESDSTALPLMRAVPVGVWLSDSVTLVVTEEEGPSVRDPVEEGLPTPVGDTEGELEAYRERVACAVALAAPEVVTVTVTVGRADGESVEDTEFVAVTVVVTVNEDAAVSVAAAVPVAPVVEVTEEVADAVKEVVAVALCDTDGDTELEPLLVATSVPVAHGVGNREPLPDTLAVRAMVEVTLPDSDAEEQGVGVSEGVYEYVPVPERLAVVVADPELGGEPVAVAHTLKLAEPLTLGEDVCELERVPDTVGDRLTVELTLTVPDTEGQLLGEPEGVPVTTRLAVAEADALAGAERVAGAMVGDTEPDGVVLRVCVCVGVLLRERTAVGETEADPEALTERVPVLQGLPGREGVRVPDTEPEADTEPVPEMEGVMDRVAEREAEPVFVMEGEPECVPVMQPVTDMDSEGDIEKERDTVEHPELEADTVADDVTAAEPVKVGLGELEAVSNADAVEEGVPEWAPEVDEDTDGLKVFVTELV